ncbi:MAG: F0F1 ATP synthase subunit B [Bacteroidota bacterium]
MDAVLTISPGLIIWTLINFTIFVLLLAKYGWKPMIAALNARENAINNSLQNAELANIEAQKLLNESQARMASAQHEMSTIIKEGRAQAEVYVRTAMEEAEKGKQAKLVEAQREISREKDAALRELRTEVATLVVQATEKLLGNKLDADSHRSMIEGYIDQVNVSKN